MNKLRLTLRLSLLFVLIGLITVSLIYMFGGFTKKEPILIGFASQLTGPEYDLGLETRNGAQLAVEKINASGGIDGRPIELIVRDDKGTLEGVRAADRALIKSGVVAIIGHASSTQTKQAIPVINAAHIVLISPIAASPYLRAMSDYVFQVNGRIDVRESDYAHYIYTNRGIKRIAIIYEDADNVGFSRPYRRFFTSAYEKLGGNVVGTASFSSMTKPDFSVLLKRLRSKGADGLLIIAASLDTALIAQRARFIGWDVPLFSSIWPDPDLIKRFGGKAIEGITIEANYSLQSNSPDWLYFKSHYQAAYGLGPGNTQLDTAAQGYEAVQILATGLRKTGGRREGLSEALSETKDFKGLIDTLILDKRGGTRRPSYVEIIQPNKIVSIKIGTPRVKEGNDGKP